MTVNDPRDDDDECPNCGGEGFVFNCFDGCCEDSEIGCDDCTRPCACQPRQASPELQDVLRDALSAPGSGNARCDNRGCENAAAGFDEFGDALCEDCLMEVAMGGFDL